jgi:hypothetical protein
MSLGEKIVPDFLHKGNLTRCKRQDKCAIYVAKKKGAGFGMIN